MPSATPANNSHTSRHRRGRRTMTSLSEINVVPLVDVMLVMLGIFMVTAPMMQSGLDVNLPEARRAEQLTEERLYVTVPLAYRSDSVVQVGDDEISIELLAERLRLEMVERTEKTVFLRGDQEITYGELVTVMDLLKDGGVQEGGLVLDIPPIR